MKLYTHLNTLSTETFGELLDLFYPICNKVSIYFPNDGEAHVMSFKETFLDATHLCEIDDELALLEPKDGFSMVIASIDTPDVQALLKQINIGLHLSFGLITDETLTFFVDEEGEIVIDTDHTSVTSHPLFETWKKID